jgi:hypothetical protein
VVSTISVEIFSARRDGGTYPKALIIALLMYYSQRFLVERFICFVIRLISYYGGGARRYAPVLSLRHAAVSRSYRRYCSFVCGCWLCSFVAR